jgi:two-component system sensor histidine kinase TorS
LLAITSPQSDGQGKAAHRLKGAASNFRLDQFCAVLARVEDGDQAALTEVKPRASAAANMLRAVAADLGLQIEAGSTK